MNLSLVWAVCQNIFQESTLGLSSTTSWMLRRCHHTILKQTEGWSQDYRLRGWHWSVWSWASQTRLHSSVCSGNLTWNVEWSKEEKRLPEIHLRSIELWSESWSYHWRIRRYELHWNAGCCACQTNCSGGNDSHDQDCWDSDLFFSFEICRRASTMKEKVRIRDLLLFSAPSSASKIQVSDQTVKEKILSARSPKTRFPLEFRFSWNMWPRQIRNCHEEIKWSLNFSPSLNLLFFCLTKLLLLSNPTSPILFSTNKWSYKLHR